MKIFVARTVVRTTRQCDIFIFREKRPQIFTLCTENRRNDIKYIPS